MNMHRALLCLFLVSGSVFAAEPIKLRAGRVSMQFEPDNAFVRYVRVDDLKVLQGLSAPVRDQFWGTVPTDVTNVRVQQTDDAFQLTYDVSCRQGAIDFAWRGSITGNAKGNVTFAFDGEARSEFLRNRIGFCVLHGPEAAGRACLVEAVDGTTQKGHFPKFIAPHQPFKNIRMVSHELTDGLWANVRMEGDTFEMEDQRNWTDASFKTYCTPLEISYPVRIAHGTKVVQKIEISFTGLDKLPAKSNDSNGPIVVRVAAEENKRQQLPKLGLQVSEQAEQLTDAEIVRLRELSLDHLRVDLTPAEPLSSIKLLRAADQATRLAIKLHVGLHLSKNAAAELDSLAAVLKQIPQPRTWLLITADEEQVRVAREFLARTGQKGRLGRGEDSNFTELNRQRPDPTTIDVVSFGLNPQIHAFDNTSIVETLEVQGDAVRSAKQFIGDRPLLISPITFKKQALDVPPAAGTLPANVDPRQTSLFAAAWTLGSVKYLAEAGVDSATYFETVGWKGIMETASGSPLPKQFESRPGQLFPIYHVLRELAPFAGGHVRETSSADPMSVVGLSVEHGNNQRLLLANLTSAEQSTCVFGFSDRIALRQLDANGFAPADGSWKLDDRGGVLVKLPPHGISVLELGE